MNVVVWNVRGVNTRYKQKGANKFKQSNEVGLIDILENKVKHENVCKIINKIAPSWSV